MLAQEDGWPGLAANSAGIGKTAGALDHPAWDDLLGRLAGEPRRMVADLADCGRVSPFRPGAVLARQGFAGSRLIVLLDGSVRTSLAQTVGGRQGQVPLWRSLPGDILTPGAALGEPEFFSAIAEGGGYFLEIPVDRLPQTVAFYQQLTRQYRVCATTLSQRLVRDGGKPLMARLAGHLLAKADEAGIVSLGSKGDLAVQLGVTRESLSRAFAKLRQHGVAAIDRQRVRITSRAGLEALSRTPRLNRRR